MNILIIGQGIAGSCLAWELKRRGSEFTVADRPVAETASRVAAGDLPEGERLFGRSVMASEYGVSPETIRRALRMLADMKVIDVKPQSGAVVLSRDNARRYLEDFSEGAESRTLRMQLRQIVQEYEELNRRMEKVSAALLRRLFGVFLLFVGVSELRFKTRGSA